MSKSGNIFAHSVKSGLETKVFGQNILFFDKIDSTNIKAKTLSKEGIEEGTIVIAEEQNAGRGRLDRAFYAPKGMGLWFSLILRPKFKITEASKCTLLAAVAVARALLEIGITPKIKWPNDIVHKNKKLVGILTELVVNDDGAYSVIIGIGINVNFLKEDFPEDIRDIATSLAIIKGEDIDRIKFLQRVLFFLEKLYNKAQSEGFDDILDLWRKFSITLNKNIRVINAGDGEEIIGRAVDIDGDGALLVETDGEIIRVLAGDVSVREMGS